MDDDGTEEDDPPDDHDHERKWQQDVEPLDFSASSGAVGSEQKSYDVNAPESHDGRADTRTTFYPEEGEGNTNYERLAKLNDGLHEADRKQLQRRANRQRDCEVFCSALNFTDFQKTRAQVRLSGVEDIRRFESTEVLLLAICSLVANEDERKIRDEETFQELCEDCGVDRQSIRNARKKLQE